MATWQVQQAKSHFSELMEKAVSEGPQTITKHGAEAAVLVSAAEYLRLTRSQPDFKDFLRSVPKIEDFDSYMERDKDSGTDFEFE